MIHLLEKWEEALDTQITDVDGQIDALLSSKKHTEGVYNEVEAMITYFNNHEVPPLVEAGLTRCLKGNQFTRID